MRVLIACEESQEVCKAFRATGMAGVLGTCAAISKPETQKR